MKREYEEIKKICINKKWKKLKFIIKENQNKNLMN